MIADQRGAGRANVAHRFAASFTVWLILSPVSAGAQSGDSTVELVAARGTPLRVALDQTVAVHRSGDRISGTLVEPLYAYDRIVLPAGAPVVGHVASLRSPSKLARLRAWSAGNFAPARQVVIEFDEVGATPVQATAENGQTRVRRSIAEQPSSSKGGMRGAVGERARESLEAAKQRARDAFSAVKEPGRGERLKMWLLTQLPYHHQYLSKGTVFDAPLQAPVVFARVEPAPLSDAGVLPAPSSLLRVRLVTSLDSSVTKRGADVDAVLTEPVFSSDHHVVLPEGTHVAGEVTAVKPARRFHRNGQLRFLFERVQTPQRESKTLLASLYSADVGADAHLAVDEEGGARAADSKTRFIAPALAVLAFTRVSDRGEHHLDADDPGFGSGATTAPRSNLGARSFGGFFGFGLIGIGVARLSQPLGIIFTGVGVARTVYSNVLGRGQEVRFAAGTPIELQLAPGPSTGPLK